MPTKPHILGLKQPRRPHFIPAWAERRHLSQADLARELGADKGLVSRWFNGSTPGVEWQERLAALFHCEPEDLFRHPNEDWLKRFFDGRSEEEIEHIKRSLEVTFPKKSGTDG
jgi:transcriptional regulator with XRE-family HTH domain